MILGSLNDTEAIEDIHPLFKKSFDYLKTVDLTKIEATTSNIEIDGKNVFVLVQEYQGKTKEEVTLEAHKKYIDIQIVVEGSEQMGWLDINKCTKVLSPYDKDKDVAFFENPVSSFVTVNTNEFAIFFPEDAHAPGAGNGLIKKMVIKVLV